MHIFVTGGSGQTGPAIVSEIIANSHIVTALARSGTVVERLVGLGAKTLHGSLDDLQIPANGGRNADGVGTRFTQLFFEDLETGDSLLPEANSAFDKAAH